MNHQETVGLWGVIKGMSRPAPTAPERNCGWLSGQLAGAHEWVVDIMGPEGRRCSHDVDRGHPLCGTPPLSQDSIIQTSQKPCPSLSLPSA